jgi:multiple sugar transport system ATP-binding protein
MIAGLEDITSGELRIGGTRVNDKAPKDRDIAMVFQSYALYPNMSVRENMAFPLKLAKLPKAEIDKKVGDAAKVLELTDHLDRKPANLSGGQRQRVAMGRAIVRSPKAFLMDEPLSNLDAKLRVQMRTQVSRLQKQLGTTTVYVTHDQTEAMTLGDRVVVMRAGRIQQVGDPQTLYDHPLNLFVAGFIGSPSMNFLPAEVSSGRLVTPLGELPIGSRLQRMLAAGDAPRELVLGIRPEHFQDSSLVEDHQRAHGFEFTAPVDLVESMGSDKYVYFTVEGDAAAAADLEDLAADAGGADLPHGRTGLVTRLSAESRVREGADAKVWMNLDKIHLFDPADGRNVTLHEGRAAGVVAS